MAFLIDSGNFPDSEVSLKTVKKKKKKKKTHLGIEGNSLKY